MLAINGGEPLRKKTGKLWPRVTDHDRTLLQEVVRSGVWKDGPMLEQAETMLAAECETDYCFCVANGTVSLEMILRGFGIGWGDEVILPPYTFVATLSSVMYAGATPVFADIDRSTFLLSPEDTERKITPKTRAIIAVAVGGRPMDVDAFEDIARRHGIKLIIDAAQAIGAKWKGKSLCSYGDAASISCQNTKNLTCGEGGIIATNDDELAERISLMLNRGKSAGRYITVAQNHSMTEFQASILCSQMDKLHNEIITREKNACYLDGRLKSLPFFTPLAVDSRITVNAYHIHMARLNREALAEKGLTLKKFIAAMNAEGIEVCAGYVPLYTFPLCTSDLTRRMLAAPIDTSPLPECEILSYEEGVWMIQHFLLGDYTDMDDYADAAIKIWENAHELSDGQERTDNQWK